MSKRIKELFLFDIYIAILKIEKHSEKFNNGEDLKYSYIDWDIVMREFGIIGEAMNNLIKENIYDNSKRAIVDFRNILIHEYFGIDSEEVWSVIKYNLPSLKQDIKKKILNLSYETFDRIFSYIFEENKHIYFIHKCLIELKVEKYENQFK
jgi:uncharacterized protein with HEPN domain